MYKNHTFWQSKRHVQQKEGKHKMTQPTRQNKNLVLVIVSTTLSPCICIFRWKQAETTVTRKQTIQKPPHFSRLLVIFLSPPLQAHFLLLAKWRFVANTWQDHDGQGPFERPPGTSISRELLSLDRRSSSYFSSNKQGMDNHLTLLFPKIQETSLDWWWRPSTLGRLSPNTISNGSNKVIDQIP